MTSGGLLSTVGIREAAYSLLCSQLELLSSCCIVVLSLGAYVGHRKGASGKDVLFSVITFRKINI